MNLALLDTGCIDLFLNREGGKYTDFQRKIEEHELNGGEVGTTIINYAERQSGLKKWEAEIHFPERIVKNEANMAEEDRQYKVSKIRQINEFFKIISENGNLLIISEKTAEIYADIHFKIKNKSNNIQKGELKNMHNDLWIASLCIEHNATLYTLNKKDFEKIRKTTSRLTIEYVKK